MGRRSLTGAAVALATVVMAAFSGRTWGMTAIVVF